MDVDARAFGQLEGKVEALNAMLIEQNKALAALQIQLDLVQTTLAEAQGGWRTLLGIGGAVATAGAVISWFLAHVPFTK